MEYQEALQTLAQNIDHREGMDVKMVPGRTTDGWLTAETREELQNMFSHGAAFLNPDPNAPQPSVQTMRDGMGATHRSVARHELKIDNVVLNGSIIARSYRRADLATKILPTIIYVHGGAFYGGSMMAVDDLARALADKGAYQVFNLEYALAPEHPFPAALLDCYNAIFSLHEHARRYRIKADEFYMSGDSAGGNLTVATAYLDRAVFKTNLLKKIVLYFPDIVETEAERLKYAKPAGMKFNEMGDELQQFIKFFNTDRLAGDLYRHGQPRDHHLISLLDADHLELLPPTELIVGEFDPLLMQDEAFIHKLRQLNVSTKYIRYNGVTHAFLDHLGYYPQAEDAITEGVKFLMA